MINAELLKKIQHLETQNKELKSKVKELDSRLEDDAVEIARWKDLYFSEKDRRYGRKNESDSIPNSVQLLLFDELENAVEADTKKVDPNFDKKDIEQKKTAGKTYSRVKGKKASLTIDSNAPVVDIYHEVEKINCDNCGAELTEIGEFIEDKKIGRASCRERV